MLFAQKAIKLISFQSFFFIFFSLLFAGCGLGTQLFKIDSDPLINYDSPGRINLTAELRLTKKFRSYTWDAPTGLPYTLDLGDSLSSNAEDLCKSLFRNVIVTDGTEAGAVYDVVLIPDVVFLDKTQAGYSFQMVEMEIHVEWKLIDTMGKTIWVDTIKGFGREKMGGPISFEKNTRKQIRMAMTDMFNNSYTSILKIAKHFKWPSN